MSFQITFSFLPDTWPINVYRTHHVTKLFQIENVSYTFLQNWAAVYLDARTRIVKCWFGKLSWSDTAQGMWEYIVFTSFKHLTSSATRFLFVLRRRTPFPCTELKLISKVYCSIRNYLFYNHISCKGRFFLFHELCFVCINSIKRAVKNILWPIFQDFDAVFRWERIHVMWSAKK